MQSVLFRNFRVVTAEIDETADVFVKNGVTEKLGSCSGRAADTVFDGGGRLFIMPSLFDMHVHFRDPGQTHKEDIPSGCKAALAGGVTGVACMPNTLPRVDSAGTVKYITEKAAGSGVEVYPAGCVTKNMAGKEIYDHSALGVKLISDDGFPVENAGLLRQALIESKKNGILVCSHCEDLNIINEGIMNKGSVSEKLGFKGMDRLSEDSITERDIKIAEDTGAKIHICHVSTAGSADIIRRAKARGVKVTAETCPHYFSLTEDKLNLRDADYRMNPPLREENDRKAIIEALSDGTIDCISTDHAPHSREEKSDFFKAPNGIVGLETSLAVSLTYLYHTGIISLKKIISLMCENPRKILGTPYYGITEGSPAYFAVADPDLEWTVDPGKFYSKSKNTPFKGMTLKGKNLITVSGGVIRFNILGNQN